MRCVGILWDQDRGKDDEDDEDEEDEEDEYVEGRGMKEEGRKQKQKKKKREHPVESTEVYTRPSSTSCAKEPFISERSKRVLAWSPPQSSSSPTQS